MHWVKLFFFPREIEDYLLILRQAAVCGLACIAHSSHYPDYMMDGVRGLPAVPRKKNKHQADKSHRRDKTRTVFARLSDQTNSVFRPLAMPESSAP